MVDGFSDALKAGILREIKGGNRLVSRIKRSHSSFFFFQVKLDDVIHLHRLENETSLFKGERQCVDKGNVRVLSAHLVPIVR